MKTRLVITLTTILMLAGISANAQNSGQTPSTSSIVGDLNDDKKVNAADVVLLVNFLKSMSLDDNTVSSDESLFVKEDINKDGYVNHADVEELVSLIMDIRFAAIDVTGETEYADKLLLCSNGSYVLCDGENEKGYTVIHVNEESKDVADGITFFIDTNGDPVMMSTKDGHLLFYHVENSGFDFAYINNKNETSYYNDVKCDFQMPIVVATRGFLNLYKDAFTGGWDEHSKKALKLCLIKCLSFGITALNAVKGGDIISPIITLNNELDRSFGERNEENDRFAYYLDMGALGTTGIANGFFSPQFSVSYIAYRLNKYADSELDKMGQFEQIVAPHFNGQEWQITLEPDVLEFSAEKDGKVVNIKTKAKWVLDKSKFDESWCTIVNQTDEQIGIRVSENYDLSERACYLFFYSPYSNDIFTKSLAIRQSGCKFKLSKRVIVFNPVKSSETVYCQPNGTSYKIKSCPKWCTAEKVSVGYNLFVEKSLYEERQEELVITATVGDEEIDRSVLLIQKPLCPDENHPHMIDLGLPSGTKWSCCNAGASSPDKMGNYYSWGNTTPNPSDNYWYDSNYPFFEWIDSNNNGIKDNGELSLKKDEAYNSAVNASWGVGSLPTNSDYDELREILVSSSYYTIGNIKGVFYTGINGNSIFVPFTTLDRTHYGDGWGEYWTYKPGNNGAWFCSYFVSNGQPSQWSAQLSVLSQNDIYKYSKGRTIRPVSK